jgi:hypothetical protein
MATPRRAHTNIRVVVVLGFFACSKDEPAPIKPVGVPVADAAPVVATTDAGASPGKITISVTKPKAPGTGFAKRCAVGGPPLATTCTGSSKGIAIDNAGTIYVANEKLLHRYTADADCKLAPAGEPIELPADNPRPQALGKGPVYMRSGGVSWGLVRAGNAIYAHDFLVGLFRVDRGKVEPTCTQEFGFHGFAPMAGSRANDGKRLLAQRKGIEVITLGKAGACKAKSAGIDDKARALFAVGDRTYTKFDDLGVRICHASAMAACGDGACILDHNCPQIVQLAADGAVLRTIEGEQLFDVRPWSIDGLATATDGSVYVYARHRDKVDGNPVCEAAVYRIPAAVFER